MLVCSDHATSADYKITYLHPYLVDEVVLLEPFLYVLTLPSHILLLFALAYLFSYRLSSVLILPHLRWTHKCEVS